MKSRSPVQPELVLQAQRGDRAAAAELLKRMDGLLRYLAARHARLPFDDALQEVRLGFLRAVQLWRPNGASFPRYATMWANALARRAGERHLRHSHAHLPLEVLGTDPDGCEPGDSGAGAAAMEQAVSVAEAQRVLDAEDSTTALLVRSRATGVTLDELGRVLHLTREGVRKRLARALASLAARAPGLA